MAEWETLKIPRMEYPQFPLFPDAAGKVVQQLPNLWVLIRCLAHKLDLTGPLIPRSLYELSLYVQELEAHELVLIAQPRLEEWTELRNRLHQIEKKLGLSICVEMKQNQHDFPSVFEKSGMSMVKKQLEDLRNLFPEMPSLPRDSQATNCDVISYAADVLAELCIKYDMCPQISTGFTEHFQYVLSSLRLNRSDPRTVSIDEEGKINIDMRVY
jgi:hypothetical protein